MNAVWIQIPNVQYFITILIYYDQSAAIWALLRQDVIAVNNETISLYPRNYFVIRTQHVEVDRNPASFIFFKRNDWMFFPQSAILWIQNWPWESKFRRAQPRIAEIERNRIRWQWEPIVTR